MQNILLMTGYQDCKRHDCKRTTTRARKNQLWSVWFKRIKLDVGFHENSVIQTIAWQGTDCNTALQYTSWHRMKKIATVAWTSSHTEYDRMWNHQGMGKDSLQCPRGDSMLGLTKYIDFVDLGFCSSIHGQANGMSTENSTEACAQMTTRHSDKIIYIWQRQNTNTVFVICCLVCKLFATIYINLIDAKCKLYLQTSEIYWNKQNQY